MNDIVERLREHAATSSYLTECRPRGLVCKAADEIERLRAALRKIAHSADYGTIISPDGDRHQQAVEIALETLAGNER